MQAVPYLTYPPIYPWHASRQALSYIQRRAYPPVTSGQTRHFELYYSTAFGWATTLGRKSSIMHPKRCVPGLAELEALKML